jgi:cellulose 1,4-beta-cellobiosidase
MLRPVVRGRRDGTRDSVTDDTFNRGQCGGRDWTGATCCVSGSTCVKQHDYYSQCLPGSSQPSSTTSSSTVVRTTTTSTSTTAATSTTVGTTTTTVRTTTTTAPNPGNSGTATYSGNPFSGVSLWANK